MPARGKPNGKHQGMNSIRQDLRVAIYVRDNGVCPFCGDAVTLVEALADNARTGSVDHVTPYSHGGDNSAANLILAHKGCNSARGDNPLTYPVSLMAEIRTARPITANDRKTARSLLSEAKDRGLRPAAMGALEVAREKGMVQ